MKGDRMAKPLAVKLVRGFVRDDRWERRAGNLNELARSLAKECECSYAKLKFELSRALVRGGIVAVFDPEDPKTIIGYRSAKAQARINAESTKDQSPSRIFRTLQPAGA
jgi:hypothetical protein